MLVIIAFPCTQKVNDCEVFMLEFVFMIMLQHRLHNCASYTDKENIGITTKMFLSL